MYGMQVNKYSILVWNKLENTAKIQEPSKQEELQ